MQENATSALFEDAARSGETVNGYRLDEVKSALQKAIRRGQDEEAMFWAREMMESGKDASLWQRLSVIAVEDCSGMMPLLFVGQCASLSKRSREPTLCAVRAALELARSEKDRTADDYLCWIGDKLEKLNDTSVLHDVPDEALDMHTKRGRKLGRKEASFFHVGARLENESPFYDKRYCRFLKAFYPMYEESGD